MTGGFFRGCAVQGADEFRIVQHLIPHVRVFAANRAMHHVRAGCGRDFTRCANRNSTVDDRQLGPIRASAPRGFANKIADLKGITNVHHLRAFNWFSRTLYVHSNSLTALRKNGEERFAYLPESDNQNGLLVTHGSSYGTVPWSFEIISSDRKST